MATITPETSKKDRGPLLPPGEFEPSESTEDLERLADETLKKADVEVFRFEQAGISAVKRVAAAAGIEVDASTRERLEALNVEARRQKVKIVEGPIQMLARLGKLFSVGRAEKSEAKLTPVEEYAKKLERLFATDVAEAARLYQDMKSREDYYRSQGLSVLEVDALARQLEKGVSGALEKALQNGVDEAVALYERLPDGFPGLEDQAKKIFHKGTESLEPGLSVEEKTRALKEKFSSSPDILLLSVRFDREWTPEQKLDLVRRTVETGNRQFALSNVWPDSLPEGKIADVKPKLLEAYRKFDDYKILDYLKYFKDEFDDWPESDRRQLIDKWVDREPKQVMKQLHLMKIEQGQFDALAEKFGKSSADVIKDLESNNPTALLVERNRDIIPYGEDRASVLLDAMAEGYDKVDGFLAVQELLNNIGDVKLEGVNGEKIINFLTKKVGYELVKHLDELRISPERKGGLIKTLTEKEPYAVARNIEAIAKTPEERRRIMSALIEKNSSGLFDSYCRSGLKLLSSESDALIEAVWRDDRQSLYSNLDKIPFSPDRKQALVQRMTEKDPVNVLIWFEKIGLPEGNRPALLDRAMAFHPVELTGAMGSVKLSVEQKEALRKVMFEKHPKELFESADAFDLSEEKMEQLAEYCLFEKHIADGELAEDAFSSFPELVARAAERRADLTPDQLLVLAKASSNRFLYSMEGDNYETAVNQQVKNRDAARLFFEALPPEKQQEALPSLIEHALDFDFGSNYYAQSLLEMVTDPKRREEVAKQIALNTPELMRTHYIETLEGLSESNRKRDLQELSTEFGKEKVENLVEEIGKRQFFTINAGISGIVKILESGRVKSCWETGARGEKSYRKWRDRVERMLAIRSKGSEEDPHPIYGAVAFGNQEKTGAAPCYGEAFIRLKTEKVKDRIGFNYGDSFKHRWDPAEYDRSRYSFEDVAAARAKMELKQNVSYIEFQILGGVSLDDIESINIPERYKVDPAVEQLLSSAARHGIEVKFV